MPALTLADRVAETTTTTGTGTLALGGIVGGAFRTFVDGAGNGAVVPYVIVHRTANEWEVGYGTVTDATPDTLSRTAVYASSNAHTLVNFSAGTKDVFLSLPAARISQRDANGQTHVSAGSAALPSLVDPTDPNTGPYHPAADTWAVATGGTEHFRVAPNGTLRRGSLTGVANSQKISLGSGTSFSIDLAALFSGAITISGNFRYGRITFMYFISGRATIEEWLFSATNASVVAMTLIARNSAGAAITGTPTLTSTDAVLSIALTTDASLAAGAYIVELAVV